MLAGIALVFVGVIALHLYLTNRKVEQLRAEVLSRIAGEIEPVREALVAQRAEVTALSLARYRAPAPSEPFVAEGLTLEALREGPALSLRLRRAGPLSEGELARVVQHGAPDEIGNCLGIPNQPASTLYAGEDFLGEGFTDSVREADSVLALRGLSDQLGRRITHVLPEIQRASGSGHLFLAIDRAEGGEVEVYIVDLESGRDVLRAVAEAEGRFVSALVAVGGVRARRADEEALAGVRGAADCGVASRIRALLTD